MYASAPLWEEFYRRLHSKAQRLIDPETGKVAARYVETVPCPVCGSTSSSPRVERDGFTYVNCHACSFVYVNPQLRQQAIKDVYNDEDVRKFFFESLLLPHVESDQRAEFEERAGFLRSLVKKDVPCLLDVGCAAGNFLTIAERHGFQAEGLELNTLYFDYMRNHRRLKVHNRLLEEMHYPDESFDVVTLWDVPEHLPRPLETLAEVSRVIRPGGVIGLTTINHACLNERILKSRWRYYMPPDHLCSFTPSMLNMILDRNGFTVLKTRHHYMFEVLADHYFPWLKVSSPRAKQTMPEKIRKLMYVILAHSSQALFGAIKSGDLLTVYARKF